MLYVSTRNKSDAYTASHAIQKDACSDGGWFIPKQIPVFTREQLSELKEKSFCQCVAEVLNLFFNARLGEKDVEFCIGKRPVRIHTMSHKILVAELWHNPEQTLQAAVDRLMQRVLGGEQLHCATGNWARLCVLIAFLFGIYARLRQTEECEQRIDIAVGASDFTGPIAAWYARKMGLPIRTVICGCDDNGALWDLLYYGTVSDAKRITPDAEQYIYHTLGQGEAVRFAQAHQEAKPYSLSEEQCAAVQDGLFAAVVSSKRSAAVIGSVYRTNACVLEPDSALAFSGLQDYRTGAGETVPALIVMKDSPVCSANSVAAAIGMTEEKLQELLRSR